MKQRGRGVRGLVIGAAVLLVTGACGAAGGTEESSGAGDDDGLASMDPIVLTATDMAPESGSAGNALTAMMEQIESESDGKISFEVYWSSALMPGEEMLSGIGAGVADMGQLVTAYYPQDLPVSNFLSDLGAMPNNSFPLGALQGYAAANEMYVTSEPIVEEFESHNIKVLAGGYGHRYSLFCTEPVESIEDAEGLRVRTGGQVWSAELEALGMVPVPMPLGELYEALQRGVLDCAALNPNSNIVYSLWEVADHFYQVDLSGLLGAAFIMNLETWDSLPGEAQAVVANAADRYYTVYTEGLIQEHGRFATEGVEEHGVVFGDPEPFDRALEDHHREWFDTIQDRAPESLEDPDAFVAEFNESLDRWESVFSTEFDIPEYGKNPDEIQESFVAYADLDMEQVYERLVAERE